MRCFTAAFCFIALLAPFAQAGSIKTYIYSSAATETGTVDLHMDFYTQNKNCASPRPTLLYIHGGGFVDGDRTAESEYHEAFWEAGFNYVSVDYRKVHDGPAPKKAYLKFAKKIEERAKGTEAIEHPDVIYAAASAFEDIVSALTFLKQHRRYFCHDPARVVVMGLSAGAVAAINVAYSLDNYGISRPSLRGAISHCGGFHARGSLSNRDLPLLLIHGTDDDIVPFTEVEMLYEEAVKTRTPVQLLAFEGEGHCMDLFEAQAEGKAVLEWVLDFAKAAVAGRKIKTLHVTQ